jgi:hypothetical protein
MKQAIPLLCLVSLLAACSQKTAAPQKLDENNARFGIMALNWPHGVSANSNFIVDVEVANAGEVVLPALGKDNTDQFKVGLSYHWRQVDEKVVVWDGAFTPLKKDLKKGDDDKLQLAVKAPPAPGKYILEIDGLQNGALWFAGVGSQSARITIDVK